MFVLGPGGAKIRFRGSGVSNSVHKTTFLGSNEGVSNLFQLEASQTTRYSLRYSLSKFQ
jgi:hypothetical protein